MNKGIIKILSKIRIDKVVRKLMTQPTQFKFPCTVWPTFVGPKELFTCPPLREVPEVTVVLAKEGPLVLPPQINDSDSIS